MPDLVPGDLTLGTKESVGRYFSLVSAIPSLVLALYLYLVVATGPLSGRPHLATLGHNLTHNEIAQAAAVTGFAIVLALILHPLQFAMVQTLEGYTWGRTAPGRELQARRAVSHLTFLGEATREATKIRTARVVASDTDREATLLHGDRRQRLHIMRREYSRSRAQRTIEQYPTSPIDVLPTRLGNVLRRHELIAGGAYGLPFLQMSSHVGLVADASHLEYMQDQRNALDLAARMAVTSGIAAVATTALMWPHGLWLLVALGPYAAGYVSYRGAVGTAATYGAAMIAVSDLNRFKLYDALKLPTPADTGEEKVQNSQMLKLRNASPTLNWAYKRSEAQTPQTPAALVTSAPDDPLPT